jgi:thymidine kinase
MANYHNFKNGYLDVIMGPMFCGKTTEILRKLNIYAEMGFKVLYINSNLDNRSNNDFSTHSSYISSSGKIDTIRVKNLDDISNINEYKIIGVDEAQMFRGLKDKVLDWVEKENRTVVVSGLNGDFLRRPFGEILDLIPYCDTLQKLTPFCFTCSKDGIYTNALFSKRVKEENKDTILIGGIDSYIPVCRKCYLME